MFAPQLSLIIITDSTRRRKFFSPTVSVLQRVTEKKKFNNFCLHKNQSQKYISYFIRCYMHTFCVLHLYSCIKNHTVYSFPYWHLLFVFSISDWFPIVYRSRCMAAVCCVSCYSKPWLVLLSSAGQTGEKDPKHSKLWGHKQINSKFSVCLLLEILNTWCIDAIYLWLTASSINNPACATILYRHQVNIINWEVLRHRLAFYRYISIV